MHSEFKSATQIYVNPIHFEIQLILGNDLFCIHDDQNWWNRKNCPKFFHRVIFAFWIQICNPNLCKSHIFWITANIENDLFFAYPDLMKNRWNRKNCPKFFHRVIFAFWIQICNLNLCKSHTFWNTANIEKWPFFAYPDDDQNWWKKKNCPKFFHGVIFALWIQICNPNLCKSHIFWITANIENWPFFAYADLMTKIDEIKKIARNSFIG